MNAPFFKYGLFGDDTSLVVAFVIGIAFGFFLERGGFGSGRKLAAQFYFKDMAVLKVMFTGIITAMVGVYWLSRVGVLDLSLVYLVPTRPAANMVGGLLMGVGFVVGGYCPGTSVVAAATGRIDAMVYLAGMISGMGAVGFVWPSIEGWVKAGGLGPATLPGLSGIPYGVVVALVVAMAVVAFFAAEWGEVKSGGRALAEQSLFGVHKLTRTVGFFVVLLGLASVAAFAGSPYRGPRVTMDGDVLARTAATGADHVSPSTLADRLIAGTNDYRIIDLREPEAYAKDRIPGAENVPMTALPSAHWAPTDPVLLYSEDSERAAQAWLYLKARGFRRVSTLAGGYAAWRDQVVFPALAEPKDEAARLESERRRAIGAHFGGAARIALAGPSPGLTPVPTPAPQVVPPPAPQVGTPPAPQVATPPAQQVVTPPAPQVVTPPAPMAPAAAPASGARKKEGC